MSIQTARPGSSASSCLPSAHRTSAGPVLRPLPASVKTTTWGRWSRHRRRRALVLIGAVDFDRVPDVDGRAPVTRLISWRPPHREGCTVGQHHPVHVHYPRNQPRAVRQSAAISVKSPRRISGGADGSQTCPDVATPPLKRAYVAP